MEEFCFLGLRMKEGISFALRREFFIQPRKREKTARLMSKCRAIFPVAEPYTQRRAFSPRIFSSSSRPVQRFQYLTGPVVFMPVYPSTTGGARQATNLPGFRRKAP